ncbi:MAG: class I SAM-dependent methyltransferase, partial [Chloroflexota bacterium]|nr:class I SAM-dependent methyltransferase [Chloroflexota bacterium]
MARNFLFDWVAPFYDRLFRPANSDRLRHLLQLPIEGLLLDAAGGTGRASTQFCSQVGALVINDLSAAMLQQAAGKCVHGVICSPVERLPFAAGRFERIMVVDALHHFSAQRSGLSELLRVLSPGGRLVIEEPDIER